MQFLIVLNWYTILIDIYASVSYDFDNFAFKRLYLYLLVFEQEYSSASTKFPRNSLQIQNMCVYVYTIFFYNFCVWKDFTESTISF